MKKIEFKAPSERIIGLTIPENDSFYILDQDEVFKAKISDKVEIERTKLDPSDFVDRSSSFIGLAFLDIETNAPILSVNGNTISYSFNPSNDFVDVQYIVAGKAGEIKFRTFSGDWFCASFSKDGKHIILAEPYGIALYSTED